MLDGDCVEGLEAVNDAKFGAGRSAVGFLDDGKPTRSV